MKSMRIVGAAVVILAVIGLRVAMRMQPTEQAEGRETSSATATATALARPATPGHDLQVYWDWMDQSFGPGTSGLWSTIAESGKLYTPAVGMKEALAGRTPDNTTPLNVADLNLGVHMAQVTLPNGDAVTQAAAYTTAAMLKGDEFIQQSNARGWLEQMLYFEPSDGIVLNPPTRFVREEFDGVYSSMNRVGVAEMVGFMEVKDNTDPRPFHVLANEAAKRGDHYQVLYYWGRSYRTPRPGDDWKQCEVAKLRAYEALDFPGSRARARSEGEWMMSNHPSPEVEALLREFAAAR